MQGIAVYLVFGKNINCDFITNLDNKNNNYIFYFNNWIAVLTQFIICIACFAAIPIFAFESRTNLHSILMSLYRTYLFNKNNIDNKILSKAEDTTNLSSKNNGFNNNSNNNINDVLNDALNINNDNSDNSDNDSNNSNRKISNDKARNSKHITKSNISLDSFDFEIETIKSRWIEGTFICISACIVALEIKNLNLMLTLSGATYGCYIMFILPSLLYIKSINNTKLNRNITKYEIILNYSAYLMLFIGAIIAIAGITTALI